MRETLAVLAMLSCALAASPQSKPGRAGTVIQPSDQVSVPKSIRNNLPDAADFRAFFVLPNQDRVVVYDTVRDKPGTIDFMDNCPHIAIFHGADTVLNIESDAPAGPVRFGGMAFMPFAQHAPVVGFAFSLGVDGSGTFFVFIGKKPDGYKVIATIVGAQAQVRFSKVAPGHFELWAADGQFNRRWDMQCVWCPKYYKRTTYTWRDGELRKLQTVRTRRGYQPETFNDAPFLLTK